MGFSLGEIVLLILVGIIVVGPKNLPGMMRTAGQWVAKLRRMSMDLRSQSGIDDLLRREGLDQHLHELRSLSRLNVVDSLIAPGLDGGHSPRPPSAAAPLDSLHLTPAQPRLPRPRPRKPEAPLRSREYPVAGCDAYGALPDDLAPYADPVAGPTPTPAPVEKVDPAAEPPAAAAEHGPS